MILLQKQILLKTTMLLQQLHLVLHQNLRKNPKINQKEIIRRRRRIIRRRKRTLQHKNQTRKKVSTLMTKPKPVKKICRMIQKLKQTRNQKHLKKQRLKKNQLKKHLMLRMCLEKLHQLNLLLHLMQLKNQKKTKGKKCPKLTNSRKKIRIRLKTIRTKISLEKIRKKIKMLLQHHLQRLKQTKINWKK